jgi:hypothetical protein
MMLIHVYLFGQGCILIAIHQFSPSPCLQVLDWTVDSLQPGVSSSQLCFMLPFCSDQDILSSTYNNDSFTFHLDINSVLGFSFMFLPRFVRCLNRILLELLMIQQQQCSMLLKFIWLIYICIIFTWVLVLLSFEFLTGLWRCLGNNLYKRAVSTEPRINTCIWPCWSWSLVPTLCG